MGYSSRFVASIAFALVALTAACSPQSQCEGCLFIQTHTPTPTPTATPGSVSKTSALPSPGVLVTFPTYQGASGQLVFPQYSAPPGTTVTLTTSTGTGIGPAPQARRRAVPVSPVAVMSIEMAFSAEVRFNNVPITVFEPPNVPATGLAEEVFDDASGALLFSALQGQAPNSIIGFSDFDADISTRVTPIDARPGDTYTLELVENPAISLPSPGPVCGLPAPVPDPNLQLARPSDGTTGVPTSIGSLIIDAAPFGAYDYYGPITIGLATSGGIAVEAGETPVPQPSPLPSPIGTPLSGGPFFEVPIPALAANTKYVATATYPVWDDTPPACLSSYNAPLGSFTTGS